MPPTCGDDWTSPTEADPDYHPGGVWEIKSARSFVLRPGQQCVYDSKLNLIKYDAETGSGIGAGTPDLYGPNAWAPWTLVAHMHQDLCPWEEARRLDGEQGADENMKAYMARRPPSSSAPGATC